MSELLPCPWCQKEAIVEKFQSRVCDGAIAFSCGCTSDECYGFQSIQVFERRSDAIKAWNTRTPSPELTEAEATIGKLCGVLEKIKVDTFYHMVGFKNGNGDRKMLGIIKELAISALASVPEKWGGK